MPIVIGTNEHTGAEDGDDYGYRNISVVEGDRVNPDPLVELPRSVKQYYAYAKGAREKFCEYYSTPLTTHHTMVVRRPVAEKLHKLRSFLLPYDREPLVVDAWRPADVQVSLFANVYRRRRIPSSIMESIDTGFRTDAVAAYVPLIHDGEYRATYDFFSTNSAMQSQFAECINGQGVSGIPRAIHYWITFQKHLNPDGEWFRRLSFDVNAMTPHGSGGSVDMYMIDRTTGDVSCLGVPFDYAGRAARMDFFEDPDNIEPFEHMRREDPTLLRYLGQHGIWNVTRDIFNRIRDERRILFHAVYALAGTFYRDECWHYNFGNEEDGNQMDSWWGSGNGCHSVLTGRTKAVWGNEGANLQARKLGLLP